MKIRRKRMRSGIERGGGSFQRKWLRGCLCGVLGWPLASGERRGPAVALARTARDRTPRRPTGHVHDAACAFTQRGSS